MTTTNIAPAQFDFQGHPIRVITRDGEPWWVANDVCAVLEIANPRDTLRKVLDEDEKGVDSVYTIRGEQQVSVINEPGLYSLVLRSRKPQARAFKRWLTHEVIPSIRRTGRYAVEGGQEPDLAELFRMVARTAAQAFAAEVGAVNLALAGEVEGNSRAIEALDRRVDRLVESVERLSGGVLRQRAPTSEALEEPIWHLVVPDDALTFDALAELLSGELGRPGLSRNQLFEVAREARLLRQLAPPYGGHSITDERLAGLFRVRRISGAAYGWRCTHHFQPLLLPQGVALIRQLVVQEGRARAAVA